MFADYDKAYKKALFDDGAGVGESPSWMPGGVAGGVPMGGGRSRKLRRNKSKKSRKLKQKMGGKKHRKSMRRMKKYSRKY
jgi:hypothetical protein